MVKLKSLPDQATIDLLAGVIDFYVWNGIPCARSWPKYEPEAYPTSAKAFQPAFSYINKMASHLPQHIIDAYKQMAGGTSLTWKDMLVRCYLNGDLI